MRTLSIFVIFMVLVLFTNDTNGWWGRSRSGSSRSRSRSSNVRRVWRGVASTAKKTWNGVKAKAQHVQEYAQGAKAMGKSYMEMRKANTIGADKYFHSKGNYDAAKYGPGGKQAAKHISDAREAVQNTINKAKNKLGRMSDSTYNEKLKDSAKDQEANEWGRNGGDPNKYRVNGIKKGY